jgi:hypothetical protein
MNVLNPGFLLCLSHGITAFSAFSPQQPSSRLPLFRPCIADPEENARIFVGLCSKVRIPARPLRCVPGAAHPAHLHIV